MLNRTYQFRLYPSKPHVEILERQLDLCRTLYNACLEQRNVWNRRRKSVSWIDQCNELPKLKKEFPEFKGVHSRTLQKVTRQLDKAFEAFFRRVKAGEEPGYPRFKSKYRYSSLIFEGNSFECINKKIRLSKIGFIKVKAYRKLPKSSKIKQAIVTRKADGWYVSLQCEIPNPKPLPKTNKAIGIDLGIRNLVMTSEGNVLGALKFLRKKEEKHKEAQRIMDRRKKGSNRRRKAAKIQAKRSLEVTRSRKAQLDIISKKLIQENDYIITEKLDIENMQKKKKGDRKRNLRKENSNAAYGLLNHMLSYKAEEAGKVHVRVDPHGTSQECFSCGKIIPKTLRDEIHSCDCGLEIDRDYNAALNILKRGLHLLRVKARKLAA